MDSFIDEIVATKREPGVYTRSLRPPSLRPLRAPSMRPPAAGSVDGGRVFFLALQLELARHPAMSHPFLTRFAEGALEREQIQLFAIQHYLYSRLFVRNLASALANTPDEGVRIAIIQNMYDEIGEPSHDAGALAGERTHPALFRRFLGALGIERERIAQASALPETARFIRTYEDICRSGHWLEALGAMACGTECLVPHLYAFIQRGLERSPHLTPDDYLFWTLHIGCDDAHGENMVRSLLPHANDPEDQTRIASGARRVLDARGEWFDGLDRLVFGRSMPVRRPSLAPDKRGGRLS